MDKNLNLVYRGTDVRMYGQPKRSMPPGGIKINLSIFYNPKNVAKLICQILMSRALMSHIMTSSADHIFQDNINTCGIDLQQCITQNL